MPGPLAILQCISLPRTCGFFFLFSAWSLLQIGFPFFAETAMPDHGNVLLTQFSDRQHFRRTANIFTVCVWLSSRAHQGDGFALKITLWYPLVSTNMVYLHKVAYICSYGIGKHFTCVHARVYLRGANLVYLYLV